MIRVIAARAITTTTTAAAATRTRSNTFIPMHFGRMMRSAATSTTSTTRPVAVFLNASRLDYDKQLDFKPWFDLCSEVRLNRVDKVTDREEMLSLVEGAEIVITKEMTIPKDILLDFPSSVKLLCEAGTGYNNIPIQAARQERGIIVCNVPTYSTDAVAHMAITYMMNFSCSMLEQQRMLDHNDRRNFTGPFTLPLMELNDKTIGLVGGAGRIGTKVAEISLALGMNVIISSRAGKLPDTHVLKENPKVQCVKDWEPLLRASDYVSIHCPLNDQTRNSFGRSQLQQMKPSAFLINTSRGAVLREDELIECLQERMIMGAGLDVTTTEPPAMDSKLWDLDNCYLSPHTGWRRIETRQRLVNMTADNIHAYCHATTEDDMINVVN